MWLWIVLIVLVLGGGGVGLFFLLSGDGEEPEVPNGPDGPVAQAGVTVEPGLCDPASGNTTINVTISPAGSATVNVTGAEGAFSQTFTESGGSADVPPGSFTWTAEAPEGGALPGETSGTFTAETCAGGTDGTDGTEDQGAFTPQETELLNHIPTTIRASCSSVSEEQAISEAVASLVCDSNQTTLFYDLFQDVRKMTDYYNSRVNEFGVPFSTGFCDSAEEAENEYVRTRGDATVKIGRLVCFRDGQNAVFIWTDDRVKISVEGLREDPNNRQLFRLWARVAFGPLK